MNGYKTLAGRKDATAKMIAIVLNDLINDGYNPTTKQRTPPIDISYEIDPKTPICKALRSALSKIKVEPKTRQDIKNKLPHIEKAASLTGIDKIPIADIKKRHVKILLEQVGILKGEKWTANNFNTYRKYLSILFSELEELDAIEFNPIASISKQKTIKKIRQVLTPSERKAISKHLKPKNYRFWLFMQIFFHSGSRETEILKVKGKDVNLKSQYFKVTIIKGEQRREVHKTIKNIALPYWKEAAQDCGKEDFVFSKGLKPGPKQIRSEQISRRWRTHVKAPKDKGGLGISADFYSLKHSHSDEIANLLSLQEAGQHNSHTSSGTTMIYAVNELERQAERLKKVGNKFA